MGCCAVQDVRRLSLCAIVFLVILRVSIGWQFLYEGMWKRSTLSSPEPWSAAGYLKNAQGPFRSVFRGMVADPYDLDKLDLARMTSHWAEWQKLFAAHYAPLTEVQTKALQKLVDDKVAELKDYLSTPALQGSINEKFKGTIDYKTTGEIELYQNLVERYEAKLKSIREDFQREHAQKIFSELEEKRKTLSAPVDAMTAELQLKARDLLTIQQLLQGAAPQPPTPTDAVNSRTILLLTVVGFCLMIGLFTRVAACFAAIFLLMIYLTIPPWPGVPQPPGPEHALWVNKNSIELVACLALACLPSGRWWGLDALIHRFVFRGKTD